MKYPKMQYLSFSPDAGKFVIDVNDLLNKQLVLTTKFDGSNCSLTRERVASRNGVYARRGEFDRLKTRHAEIRHRIPENQTLFGEWALYKHSIYYEDLPDYFLLFAVCHESAGERYWLSWDDVVAVAREFDLTTVPQQLRIRCSTAPALSHELKIWGEMLTKAGHEGFVVRNSAGFPDCEFERNVAKYVRAGHVQTDVHWKNSPAIINGLAPIALRD